ncbi:hypothetical protein LTR66_001041 [Elasticomyces elasticus]|nr:hypothetical protein LTR66_001041 [Elasticomyces elasticus]
MSNGFTTWPRCGSGGRIAMSLGNTGTLQNDTVASACNTTGKILVEPDLVSLRPTHSKDPLASATVMASFVTEDGDALPGCPRGRLLALVDALKTKHSIDLLIGFEVEVVFLKRTSSTSEPYEP